MANIEPWLTFAGAVVVALIGGVIGWLTTREQMRVNIEKQDSEREKIVSEVDEAVWKRAQQQLARLDEVETELAAAKRRIRELESAVKLHQTVAAEYAELKAEYAELKTVNEQLGQRVEFLEAKLAQYETNGGFGEVK